MTGSQLASKKQRYSLRIQVLHPPTQSPTLCYPTPYTYIGRLPNREHGLLSSRIAGWIEKGAELVVWTLPPSFAIWGCQQALAVGPAKDSSLLQFLLTMESLLLLLLCLLFSTQNGLLVSKTEVESFSLPFSSQKWHCYVFQAFVILFNIVNHRGTVNSCSGHCFENH